MKRQIFKILSACCVLIVSNFAQAQYAGLSAQCYDGTEVSLSLNTDSCLSNIGINYLRIKAQNLCSTNCSSVSGKCGVNALKVEPGKCSTTVTPLYRGFTAVCYDGYKVDFNTCSTPENFKERALVACQGHINKMTKKEGVNSYHLKARCN